MIDLFKDIFSWLPLYSYVDAGKSKIIIMHGGISDKINLKKLNSLTRNRCKIEKINKNISKTKHIGIFFFRCFYWSTTGI